ncbi:MAG: protein phosphatase 2C domain-containing protein [Prevotella sp.]|nr:protein phosphatase 2C domain-containing protein [Prevotella sp.]
MKISITASSRMGCVRSNNEDMVLVDQWCVRNGKVRTEVDTDIVDRYLIALADGMGGHNCGEVASSDVLHNLQFFFSDLPVGLNVSDFNETIYEWLSSMNNIIESKGAYDERYNKMGTTLVALAYYGREYYWMNCGDSRIYSFYEGKLTQLSTDHSLSTLVGDTTHSNVITNCIGGGCKHSFIDIVQCSADVRPGSSFLLCSDGLTDMLPVSDIAEMLAAGKSANDLCKEAEKAGGFDNVSAIVATIK